MDYLSVIKEELEKTLTNVSIINDKKSLRFATTPSIYLLELGQSSQSFLNISSNRQQITVKFAVIIAMKDLRATSGEIESIKKTILNSLVGFLVADSSDISPICFFSGSNTEEKNLFCASMEFGFSFVR